MPHMFDGERVDALFAVLGEVAGRRLLTHFADQVPGEARAIAKIAAQGNLAETERHAHSLKGAAANFGAIELQAASAKVEQAAQTATPALAAGLAALDRAARQTSRAARKI